MWAFGVRDTASGENGTDLFLYMASQQHPRRPWVTAILIDGGTGASCLDELIDRYVKGVQAATGSTPGSSRKCAGARQLFRRHQQDLPTQHLRKWTPQGSCGGRLPPIRCLFRRVLRSTYCNTNTVLSAWWAEKVSGQPLGSFIETDLKAGGN